MRPALPLLAAFALSGCVSPGKRHAAPLAATVAPPPSWRTTLGPGLPIAAEWWRAFGDPQLTALVERAIANNPDVEIAASRVEEARATAALARAQLSPQVGGTVPETQGQTLSPFGTPSRAFGAPSSTAPSPR